MDSFLVYYILWKYFNLSFKSFCIFFESGQEKKKDTDETDLSNNRLSSEGSRTPLVRHGSHNSLNSLQSSSTATSVSTVGVDNPEQFQSLKHQKEIWEQGIEM